MAFSSPWPARDLPLPSGTTFRGAASTWAACPFDYKFIAASVDEQETRRRHTCRLSNSS